MVMKSCLYEMTVMHERRMPLVRRFTHKVFMFYLDLGEVDSISRKVPLFGHNQRRVFDYREADHIGNIRDFLRTKGFDDQTARVSLLTNVRTFGYVFNPVSFYFCFDAQDKPLCVVVEIGNTFKELKYFFLGPEHFKNGAFKSRQTKFYYISPFTELEDQLDFDVQVPQEGLKIGIDVHKDNKPFFFSSMTGKRVELSSAQLFSAMIRYPFVTLKVIALIHWHAAVLHFKHHVPFHYKEERPESQQGIGRKKEKASL